MKNKNKAIKFLTSYNLFYKIEKEKTKEILK